MNRHRLVGLLTSVFGFLLLAFCLWILNRELGKYSLNDIIRSFLAISDRQILLAVIFTCLGYLSIGTYDFIAFRHFNICLDKKKIIFTTFLTYAISNVTGFTLLIGGGIRYRFYSLWGVSAKNIAKITAFGNLTFWLGSIAIASVFCLINSRSISQITKLDLIVVKLWGLILIAILAVYLYCCQKHKSIRIKGSKYYFPSEATSLSQILVFSLDWALAAVVLYVLLPTNSELSYISFYSIFCLAMIASIISHVPSGLGIFEAVILLSIPRTIYSLDAIGSFLAYRTIRQLFPFSIAISIIGIFEVSQKLKHLKKKQN
jgi:glycosyltransferase 2 family protein